MCIRDSAVIGSQVQVLIQGAEDHVLKGDVVSQRDQRTVRRLEQFHVQRFRIPGDQGVQVAHDQRDFSRSVTQRDVPAGRDERVAQPFHRCGGGGDGHRAVPRYAQAVRAQRELGLGIRRAADVEPVSYSHLGTFSPCSRRTRQVIS